MKLLGCGGKPSKADEGWAWKRTKKKSFCSSEALSNWHSNTFTACVCLPAAGQTAWLGYGGHRGQQRRPRERSLVPRGRRASRGTRCFLEAGVHCSNCDTQENINLITKLYYSASVCIHWVHFNWQESSLRSIFYIIFLIKYDFEHAFISSNITVSLSCNNIQYFLKTLNDNSLFFFSQHFGNNVRRRIRQDWHHYHIFQFQSALLLFSTTKQLSVFSNNSKIILYMIMYVYTNNTHTNVLMRVGTCLNFFHSCFNFKRYHLI